jgi:hypothetical protein
VRAASSSPGSGLPECRIAIIETDLCGSVDRNRSALKETGKGPARRLTDQTSTICIGSVLARFVLGPTIPESFLLRADQVIE